MATEETQPLTAGGKSTGDEDSVATEDIVNEAGPEDWGPCTSCCSEGKPLRPCGQVCKKLCYGFGCLCCCHSLGETRHMTHIEKEKRHCTDIPCCVVMIICLLIQFIIFIEVVASGKAEPRRLIRLADFNGSVCHDQSKGGKFAAWPDIRFYEVHICLDKCKYTDTDDRMVTPPWDTDTNANYTYAKAQSLYGYSSRRFLKTMCIPDPDDDEFISSSLKDKYQRFSEKMDNFREVIDRSIADLMTAWPILFGCALGALALSFLYTQALQKIADILVWVSIVLVFVACILIGTFMIDNSARAYDFGYDTAGDLLYYGGIIVLVADVMYFFAVCFSVKRIKLATTIAKEATYAMQQAGDLLYFPLIPAAVMFAYGVYWLIVLVNLASVTHDVHRQWPSGVNTPYFTYGKTLNQSLNLVGNSTLHKHEITDSYKYAVMYHLFILMWVTAFIGYAAYMVITGVYAEWYFADWEGSEERRKKIGPGPRDFSPTAVTDWVKRVGRFHPGTVAVASFMVAAVEYCDLLLTYFEKKIVGKDPTTMQKVMLAIIHCLLNCLKCIIDRINKNGVTITAIYGWPFCASSMKGIELVFKNVVRASALDMVSGYLIGIGQVTIVAFNCAITVMICKIVYGNDVSSFLGILFVTVLITYAVSQPYLCLFDTAVNSIFICFLIDEERNGGSGLMKASSRLKRIINEDCKPSDKAVAEKKETKGLKGLFKRGEDGAEEVDDSVDTSADV